MSARLAAGRGPLASPRRWAILVGALAIVAIALTAFVLTRGPATSRGDGAAAGASAGGAAGASTGPGGQVIGTVPGFPSSIGGVSLVAGQYSASAILDKPGGAPISALLTRLGVDSSKTRLTAAVDHDQRLSIGVWEMPGASASSLVDGWKAVAGGGWESQSIAGQSVLVGTDASTSHPAYVTAADGRLIYIVTAERPLAEAAITALR